MNSEILSHHGILGQKWGIRRYQNPDGTLTEEGKRRLDRYRRKEYNRVSKELIRNTQKKDRVENIISESSFFITERLIRNFEKYTKNGENFLKELEYIQNMSYDDLLRRYHINK